MIRLKGKTLQSTLVWTGMNFWSVPKSGLRVKRQSGAACQEKTLWVNFAV